MPNDFQTSETGLNYCQCASCCVVRTAIAHGTLQQSEVGSSPWIAALTKEWEQEAAKIEGLTTPTPKLRRLADGFAAAIREMAAELRRRSESASIAAICREGERPL